MGTGEAPEEKHATGHGAGKNQPNGGRDFLRPAGGEGGVGAGGLGKGKIEGGGGSQDAHATGARRRQEISLDGNSRGSSQ